MTDELQRLLSDHIDAAAAARALLPLVIKVGNDICDRLARGGTVFTFGNGGSAADAQHFAAELVGRYLRERRPLAAVSLSTDPSVTTCIANDYAYDQVYSRQVAALTTRDDVVVGFTTSGTSPSVVAGLIAGRSSGALTVLLTGASGHAAADHADHVLRAESTTTARIQEVHVLLLHLLSEHIDRWAAGGGGD